MAVLSGQRWFGATRAGRTAPRAGAEHNHSRLGSERYECVRHGIVAERRGLLEARFHAPRRADEQHYLDGIPGVPKRALESEYGPPEPAFPLAGARFVSRCDARLVERARLTA